MSDNDIIQYQTKFFATQVHSAYRRSLREESLTSTPQPPMNPMTRRTNIQHQRNDPMKSPHYIPFPNAIYCIHQKETGTPTRWNVFGYNFH